MGLTQVNSGGINDNSIVNADLHSAANIASTKLAKPIDLADNEKVRFGTGGDLQIFHNGSHNVINGATGQNLEIQTDAFRVKNQANTEAMIVGQANGAIQLFHDNNEKLATKSDGVDITGELQCDSLDVDGATDFAGNIVLNGANYNAAWDYSTSKLKFNDAAKAVFGTSSDLEIYHDGTHSRIDNNQGDLFIQSDNVVRITNSAASETAAKFFMDGACQFYHDNNQVFTTMSGGVNIIGELECDSLDVDGSSDFSGNLNLGDNVKLRFGTHADLDIFHSGSNSLIETTTSSAGDLYVISQGTNHDLFLQADRNVYIRPNNGEAGIVVNRDGAVELMHNGSLRFETNATATTMRGGGTHRCEGHFRPWSNNAYDLGTSGDRWRNVYTMDMHLSNEGSANDVDGTWGSYTIQEGEDDLFLINRRSGKKYKFNLTEVN